MPGGQWEYPTWLEMVQTTLGQWATPRRNKHTFMEVGTTPCFLFPSTTKFGMDKAEMSKAILYRWATIINRQLPTGYPVQVIDSCSKNLARSASSILFHSHTKDMGVIVTPQPLAGVNFGDVSTCKALITEYSANYDRLLGVNWDTTYAERANCNYTDNMPLAQFFYDQGAPASGVEMLSTKAPSRIFRLIPHRSPSMAFCLKNITRPVIVQKSKTGLNLELYY